MNGLAIRRAIAPALFLVALGFLAFRCLSGCTPAEQGALVLSAENALAVKQYDDAIEDCRKAARLKPKADQFDAFTACKEKTIKEYCARSESLREHWPRCKDGE